ncbi:hypothetical protein O181_098971, partial [Austropuccinia psidii MF-1]|nr:hypothetical protein [Austropuccinia psidii MF-1]
MPIQHSPPSRHTRSHARTQAVLTMTPRAPLNGTPAVPGKDDEEEEENSVEEEDSEGTEATLQGTGRPTLSQSDQPVSHHSEPSSLAIMQQMLKLWPIFKQLLLLNHQDHQPSFIQSCQLIFPNDPANFSTDRKKVLYATSFLIGRASKWIEPYLSNLANQDPSYLLNSWKLFESQLFTLFGDPKEVRKAEAELDSLRMKEVGHVSLYIADFGSLVSRMGDWGERALINHFRRGLASHPSSIDSLQDLMDITLELDT